MVERNNKWHHALVGALQFTFVLKQGLLPHMKYLDIGCGFFRAGKHIIEYLDDGNYYGIDRYEVGKTKTDGIDILEYGIIRTTKKKFHYKNNDQFELFDEKFDMIMAWSLFTHLLEEQIDKCLCNTRKVMKKDCVFYATYFPPRNGKVGKMVGYNYCYEFETIKKLAEKNNLKVEHMKSEKFLHPNKNQTMLVFKGI